VSGEEGTDAEILPAYPEPPTPGAPGLRWSQPPAARSPVGLEQPERLAAFARLTVVGWLVSSLLQSEVRGSLRPPDQPLSGNKGRTAPPTAAVVALFTHVALVH
jgi:hypothetical protein